MSKVSAIAEAHLVPGEQRVAQYEGLSAGLNRESRNPGPGMLIITQSAVVAAWVKPGLRTKLLARRFTIAELMGVTESDDALPGMVGAIERKNASRALGRAMGNSSTRPTVTVQTRSGDFTLFFENKKRGDARAAFVAVDDLLRSR